MWKDEYEEVLCLSLLKKKKSFDMENPLGQEVEQKWRNGFFSNWKCPKECRKIPSPSRKYICLKRF